MGQRSTKTAAKPAKERVETHRKEKSSVKSSSVARDGVSLFSSSISPTEQHDTTSRSLNNSSRERGIVPNNSFQGYKHQTTGEVTKFDESEHVKQICHDLINRWATFSSQQEKELLDIHLRKEHSTNRLHESYAQKKEKEIPEKSSIKLENFHSKCNGRFERDTTKATSLDSTRLRLSQSQKTSARIGVSISETPTSVGVLQSREKSTRLDVSQSQEQPARFGESQSQEKSSMLDVSLSQEKPAKLGVSPLEENPASFVVSQSQEKRVKCGVSLSQEKHVKHGVSMSQEEKRASFVLSKSEENPARLGVSLSHEQLGVSLFQENTAIIHVRMSKPQQKPAKVDVSLSHENYAKRGVLLPQAKPASFGVSRSQRKPAKYGLQSQEKPAMLGESQSQNQLARLDVFQSQDTPSKHGVLVSEKKYAKHGTSLSQEKYAKCGISQSHEKPASLRESQFQEKPAEHGGLIAQEEKPAKLVMTSSKKNLTSSSISLSEEGTPASLGVSLTQDNPKSFGVALSQRKNPARIDVSRSQENSASFGMSVSKEKYTGFGMSVSQEKPTRFDVARTQEKPVRFGVSQLQKEKPAMLDVSLSQTKDGSVGGSQDITGRKAKLITRSELGDVQNCHDLVRHRNVEKQLCSVTLSESEDGWGSKNQEEKMLASMKSASVSQKKDDLDDFLHCEIQCLKETLTLKSKNRELMEEVESKGENVLTIEDETNFPSVATCSKNKVPSVYKITQEETLKCKELDVSNGIHLLDPTKDKAKEKLPSKDISGLDKYPTVGKHEVLRVRSGVTSRTDGAVKEIMENNVKQQDKCNTLKCTKLNENECKDEVFEKTISNLKKKPSTHLAAETKVKEAMTRNFCKRMEDKKRDGTIPKHTDQTKRDELSHSRIVSCPGTSCWKSTITKKQKNASTKVEGGTKMGDILDKERFGENRTKKSENPFIVTTSENSVQVSSFKTYSVDEDKEIVKYVFTILKQLEDENELLTLLIGVVVDVRFRVASFKKDSKNNATVVVIHFKSNADSRRFQSCLTRSREKLYFRYKLQKYEKDAPNKTRQENIKILRYIDKRTEGVSMKHIEKIREIESKFAELNNASATSNKKTKYIDISLHKQRESQKKALEYKILELKQQQDEFQSYLSDTIQRIESFKGKHVEQKEYDCLRKRFDIECSRLEQALPIYARRTQIVDTILHNQVCIILGETGSGKSTQITQYILESELSSLGKIICTQPRKVAAVSLAQRVASEMESNAGDLVGYQTGMKSKLNNHTKVLYMTDHMLLNECLKDPLLSEFSCVVIDEAHERSIYTELLLGMIKKCLPQRPTLHVVVTSATIDPDVFVRYFGGPELCPVVKVSGRMFPVEIEWLTTSSGLEVVDDYEMKCVEKAVEIHRKEPPGDILVFLTSQAEIEQCAAKLEVLLRGGKDHWILPLHGKLQTEEQNLVFKVSPKGKRKIVLATNVAETSITIPGIKYVIDTGAVKELLYDSRKKISALRVVKVTKSSADQRKGRAGRTAPGKCYRLYSKEDYEMMCPTSIPEILKIHLGHAILKLLQLEVDPLEFDFVQAPEKVSMENAFQHLSKLGAIEDGKISPLGKWIAKLPFEPNLGVLVHDAIDHNVGLEGIIIAASCTVSSSLFYRGGTQKEKERSDKLKVPFCHKHGDYFTNLNVYKEWHKVDEKQKGRWSRDNSINGKSMRSIRDAAKEILYVLKRDLSINIKFEFSDAEDVERSLQKLLFKSFQSNLCLFLGHEKAGYFFIDKNQQVIMHPSSAFQSLASCPNWVIVERVMQTSRDFGVNITAVADEDVEEALNEGSLDFDIDDVKRRMVTPVLTEYVGFQVHREFVGPRYCKVKAMQENLTMMCKDSVFVIDADRERGEISIYAPIDDREISSHTLKTAIDPIREKVRTETAEHPLLPEFTSVRISIGPGGQVQDILDQDEYKNVFVFGDSNAFHSNDEMVEWFKRFGSIQSFIRKSPKNTNSSYLGQIIFDESKFAKAAVTTTKNGNFKISARPPKGIGKSAEGDLLRARLTWCRRKSRGFGFVEIREKDKMDKIILSSLLKSVTVGGKRAWIKRGNKDKHPNAETKQLFVSGIGELANEDVLRESILNNFNISENDIGKVTIIREKVNTTPQMLHSLKIRLESEFKKYVHPNKFKVSILEPKMSDFTYQAFVTFKDPEEGFEACSRLRNRMSIGEHVVCVTPEIHTRLFVLAPVYKRVERNIETYCEKIQNEDSGRRMHVKLINDKCVIDIDADSIQSMVHTRNKVQKMLQGETVDLEKIPTLRYLFTQDGQTKVEKIMKKTNTLILLDYRNTSMSVHGEKDDREIALRKVRKYAEKLSSSRIRVFDLKGESKPPGLMKTVIVAHGVDLGGLKASSNLSTVELDHRYHRIKMMGSDDAVDKAVKSIEEIMDHMQINVGIAASNQPECGICFCEIEESDIYRLESCGHPYCRECVKLNIEAVIRNKEFPLKCFHDKCDMLWAWKDFVNMTKSGFCSLQNILNSSLSSFVMGNKDKVRYCITPDCPMVYKVSDVGGRIVCDVCRTSMCSKCHVEYHSGISCVMYQIENQNDESVVQKWMRRDPKNRRFCPNCFAGIEKNGGCPRMECRNCKSNICWTCMKFFSTSRECYGHMDKVHRTFG
ncbi:uncharacterized protein LOC125682827 [Ostrea edulis]|uniref:uncharacterized protein LOC125682827 n=1 Tax=Ostrea edulis TaxID=37623 RepID=UPI0024AE8B02|nr:uncharacterized protein LOC125682827 [Ostrea edulis]XP_056015296.1 uncharacterized protein LOC125682827 [Ostrea edulis]XP_056015301.1 uncharacterized protein LOC125682827 [Ostrea edulis]